MLVGSMLLHEDRTYTILMRFPAVEQNLPSSEGLEWVYIAYIDQWL